MAIVPEGEIGQVQQEPLPGRPYPRLSDDSSPADFGAGVGAGLESAGADVERVQESAQARAMRQANQVRIAQANTQLTQYVTDQSYTGDNAAFRQRGPDAVAMDQRYLPGLDQVASQIRSTLTPTQAAAFDVHAAQTKAEWNLQLHRYEFEESNRYAQQTFTDGIDKVTSASALNWRGMTDPTGYNLAKGQVSQMSEAMADRLRVGKKETVSGNVDKLITATVESGLADGGVPQMAQFLEAHKGEITNPAIYPILKDRVDAAQKKIEAKELDGLADKYQDAYRGGIAGVPGSTSLISREEVMRLFPKDGEQKWALLGKAAQAGASEKKFDQMSPEEIQTFLTAHDPTKQPAHLGQAQDLELYNLVRESAQRSMQRRQADGRQFAITTLGDAPINWQDGGSAVDIINARANTAADDERRLGTPMPLLSKQEASQLNQQLNAAAPGDQVIALGKLRDGLDSEQRFRSVMEQLRPDAPVLADAALRLPIDPSKAPVWYSPNYDNDPNVSRDLLTGQELLHPKGPQAAAEGKGGFKAGVAMPNETMLRQAFDANFRGSYAGLFKANPIEADHMYESFKALYAANVARLGDTSGNLNSTARDAATKALMPRMDHHFPGPAIPVPTGMDPARFPDFIKSAAKATLQSVGLNAKDFDGHGLMPLGRTGSGRYVIMQDDTNQALDPKTGNPLIIDLPYQFRRDQTIRPARPMSRPERGEPIAPTDLDELDEEGVPVRNPADDLPAIERPRA